MNIPFTSQPGGDAHALRKEFDSLLKDSSGRLNRYQKYEREYLRARYTDDTVTEFDYGRKPQRNADKQRHSIPLPYVHAITQKHTFRIAGSLPDVCVPRLGNGRVERFRSDTKEKIIYAAWRHSKAQLQFASAAHHASLLGAACFDVYYDVAAQLPRFRELHPGSVIVIPGVDDPHDFEAAFRFWRVSRASFEKKYPGVQVKDDQEAPGFVTIIQMSDRTMTTRVAGQQTLPGYPQTHDYGFVPYVVVPNLGPVEHLWGLSDYEFFKDVASYMESLNNRLADVGEAVGNGAMQDFGSGQDPDAVISAMRNGSLIPMRKDSGGIKPVDPPQFGPWVDGHFDFVRHAMNDLGFTPPAAWGDLGAASGSDRALQIAPQVELTSLKQIHFGASLQRLNSMLLQMIEMKFTGPKTIRGVHTRGFRKTPFAIVLRDATDESAPLSDADQGDDGVGLDGQPEALPANPRDLIDGDYDTDIEWKKHLDREDGQFVLTELNKFQQGVQSLYTTLERLGFADPEEEMRMIEQEAQRMPWLRSGMIALLDQQIKQAQDAGGGGDPTATGTDLSAGVAALSGGGGGISGALTPDVLSGTLNGSANGGGRGAGSVPGAQYGAA